MKNAQGVVKVEKLQNHGFHGSRGYGLIQSQAPNPNAQFPGKSESPNSKNFRTTDFTDHADMEELYSEYQCHPCNPWSQANLNW
jgi:hypothetical protein